MPQQVGMPGLDERHVHLRGEHAELLQNDQRNRDTGRGQGLVSELGPRGEAQVAALDHLDVVVGKPDGAEGRGGEEQ